MDVFLKNLTYDCSSVLNYEVLGEKVHLMSKILVPNNFAKKWPELDKNGTFLVF